MRSDPSTNQDLPFFLGCDETSGQSGNVYDDQAAPKYTGRKRQVYAPRYRHRADDQFAAAYAALHVDAPTFQSEFEQFCVDNYHPEDAYDTINPYTNTVIDSELAYWEYLREHFYYRQCCVELEKQLSVKPPPIKEQVVVTRSDTSLVRVLRAQIKSLEEQLETANKEKSESQKQTAEEFFLPVVQSDPKALTIELEKAQEKIDSITAELDALRILHADQSLNHNHALSQKTIQVDLAWRSFRRLLICGLALCIACSFIFHSRGSKSGYADGKAAGYDSGYAEGYESGHEAGAAAGYDRGYDFGYTAGERSTLYSDSYSTGSGVTRDNAIADGYIGNLNSHKFHHSWCGYLPDQENQTVFSTRDAAIAAGYDPCNRCHP